VERRATVLAELKAYPISSQTLTFLRAKWGKRMPDSLERRLTDLLSSLPKSVRKDLIRPDMAGIVTEFRNAGARTLAGQLQMLRNRLSHGSTEYKAGDLQGWARAAEVICRAQLLRLLGFPSEATLVILGRDVVG
jgi:hypothetical protein